MRAGLPRVYVSRLIPEPGLSFIKENSNASINTVDHPASREELLKETRDCEGVLITLNEKIDEEFLNNAQRIKVISSFSVGLDHVDVPACTRHGVMVTNTPDVLTEATADLAFALILATARRLVEGDRFIRRGNWNAPWSPNLLVGQEISGATLGIVGFGRIGQAVARRASGFDMRIVYNSIGRHEHDTIGKYLSLEELLKVSDIVSVHLPLTPNTSHLFGEKEFSLMKKSAIFINTSRGGIVDQAALCAALKNREIFGAGLDVFEKEPISFKDPILMLDNIVITPHLGSASTKARAGMSELAARNLIDALSGRIPKALVNKEVLHGKSSQTSTV